MTLTIELTPELTERLQAEAARRGLPAAQYATDLLAQALPPPPLSDEEWEREVAAFEKECEDITAPVIPLEALRRENLYEERGL